MLPRPGAADLLQMAQQALQDHVLKDLAGEAKLNALMALRAMAIAEAELREGATADEIERKRIQALYPEPVGETLTEVRRRLAADIRARAFAPGSAREVRLLDCLTAATAARLRAVNIKYMAQRQRGKGAESAV